MLRAAKRAGDFAALHPERAKAETDAAFERKRLGLQIEAKLAVKNRGEDCLYDLGADEGGGRSGVGVGGRPLVGSGPLVPEQGPDDICHRD